jgi:hypothetical protein
MAIDVIADRMVEAEEFDIVVFDETDGTEVIELILFEAQGAKMIDLGVDLLDDLRREDDAFATAFEVVFPHQVGVLMEDDLIHVEFI